MPKALRPSALRARRGGDDASCQRSEVADEPEKLKARDLSYLDLTPSVALENRKTRSKTGTTVPIVRATN